MPKFQIPKPIKSINKTVRFPEDVVNDVENAIKGTESNFSQFVIAAVRQALKDLEHS